MKLDKAIEIGELNVKEAGAKMPSDTLVALKILIEAGKCVRKIRHYPYPDEVLQLPGETLDG